MRGGVLAHHANLASDEFSNHPRVTGSCDRMSRSPRARFARPYGSSSIRTLVRFHDGNDAGSLNQRRR